MRNYRALAAVLVIALPGIMMACGDGDDDSPTDTGGGGSGGDGGNQGGSSGNRGGSSGQGGSNGGSSGSSGSSGNGGTAGDGGGGEETGGSGGRGGSGGSSGTGGCDLTGEGKDHDTIPADIMSDLTLTNDKIWDLEGFVKVHDGAVLTIEECTRIEGSPAPSPGVLAVLRGGQIEAVGTEDEPILFTSASPPGARE
ncbi:MAG TPA: hypothetical protein VFZ53_10770, partial [Polyangiaceae bacterium]